MLIKLLSVGICLSPNYYCGKDSSDKLIMSTCACQNLFQGGWSQI